MRQDIEQLLRSNPYPGRGIIAGCSKDGKSSIVLYFIMGRSENSRNRVFEKTEDGIRTAAFDESKMTDPSLIIYHPVRVLGDVAIITNGDQTDTIRDVLTNKVRQHSTNTDFRIALETREFEPDAPNYTPRISAVMENCGAYALSILKTVENDPAYCARYFYEFPAGKSGLGHFISTYETDADPLPSFKGEPIPIDIDDDGDIEKYTQRIWASLDDDNKVSLYARQRNIETGEVVDVIINKHEKS